MTRTFFFISLIVLTPSLCPAKTIYPQCHVDSLVRVYGSGNFVCRVTDWPNVGAVRLRVSIRGLQNTSGEKAAAANAFLKEKLNAATKISLTNIQVSAGFRAIADVQIDGTDAASLLTGAKLLKAVAPITPPVKAGIKSGIAMPITLPRKSPAATVAGKSRRAPRVLRLSEAMNTSVNLSSWQTETTFEEAITTLRYSFDPPLPIVILWRDLENNAFVEKTTPIGMDGLGRVKVGKALQLLSTSLSQGPDKVIFLVQDGLVTVASSATQFKQRKFTKVYNAPELFAPRAGMRMGGMGMGGMGGGMMGGMGGMGGMGMGNMGGGGMGNMGTMGSYNGNAGRPQRR